MMLHLYIAEKGWYVYERTIEFNIRVSRNISLKGFIHLNAELSDFRVSYLSHVAFICNILIYNEKYIYFVKCTYVHI